MNLFYITFLLIDLAIGYPLIKEWKQLLHAKNKSTRWYIAGVLILLSTLVWLLLFLVTVSSWIKSLGPGPKPYFLVMWVIVVFVYGMIRSVKALVRYPPREESTG